MEERALEATERTEELREHTEDTFREEPVRWVLRNGRLDSSTDLNGRRGDLGLWDGGDSPENLKRDYFFISPGLYDLFSNAIFLSGP